MPGLGAGGHGALHAGRLDPPDTGHKVRGSSASIPPSAHPFHVVCPGPNSQVRGRIVPTWPRL
jgi:hypothetical protein